LFVLAKNLKKREVGGKKRATHLFIDGKPLHHPKRERRKG
jgi:hypothetical protein